jgi:hypothetical protein
LRSKTRIILASEKERPSWLPADELGIPALQPRRRERDRAGHWMPACAGMTVNVDARGDADAASDSGA